MGVPAGSATAMGPAGRASRHLTHLRKAIAFVGRYARGYVERGRFTPAARPRLSIETTNICNAKCVFCANTVMERRKQPIDMALFEKAVDEFAAMGGGELNFNVTIGDPLLDPKLLERARYVHRHPQIATALGFVTTLQWLHRFPLDEFFDAGFTWLSVSTTLSGPETYERFFQVDKYEQMLGNLKTLLQENRRRGHPIAINIDIKPTDEPIERITGHPDFQAVQALTDQNLTARLSNVGFYVDDWQGAVTLPAYLHKRPLYPRPFRPCRLLYSGLMVYSNGNVGACACRDFEASSELILGNVRDTPLAEMWNGDTIRTLRRNWLVKNQVPDICSTCRHYLY